MPTFFITMIIMRRRILIKIFSKPTVVVMSEFGQGNTAKPFRIIDNSLCA